MEVLVMAVHDRRKPRRLVWSDQGLYWQSYLCSSRPSATIWEISIRKLLLGAGGHEQGVVTTICWAITQQQRMVQFGLQRGHCPYVR